MSGRISSLLARRDLQLLNLISVDEGVRDTRKDGEGGRGRGGGEAWRGMEAAGRRRKKEWGADECGTCWDILETY